MKHYYEQQKQTETLKGCKSRKSTGANIPTRLSTTSRKHLHRTDAQRGAWIKLKCNKSNNNKKETKTLSLESLAPPLASSTQDLHWIETPATNFGSCWFQQLEQFGADLELVTVHNFLVSLWFPCGRIHQHQRLLLLLVVVVLLRWLFFTLVV